MSFFGQWQCPSCKSMWTGSIGWVMPSEEELPLMLHNICGCDGHIEDAPTPELSSSMMGFKSTKVRLKKMLPRAILHYKENSDFNFLPYERWSIDLQGYIEELVANDIEVPQELKDVILVPIKSKASEGKEPRVGKLVEIMRQVMKRNS